MWGNRAGGYDEAWDICPHCGIDPPSAVPGAQNSHRKTPACEPFELCAGVSSISLGTTASRQTEATPKSWMPKGPGDDHRWRWDSELSTLTALKQMDMGVLIARGEVFAAAHDIPITGGLTTAIGTVSF